MISSGNTFPLDISDLFIRMFVIVVSNFQPDTKDSVIFNTSPYLLNIFSCSDNLR